MVGLAGENSMVSILNKSIDWGALKNLFKLGFVLISLFLNTLVVAQLRDDVVTDESVRKELSETLKEISRSKTHIQRYQTLGNEGPHGGNGIAIDFKRAADRALEFLNQSDNPKLIELARYDLKGVLNSVNIVVTEHDLFVIKDGSRQKSAAMSDTKLKTIFVNQTKWMSYNAEIKEALALHELLVFVGLEKTAMYNYSYLLAMSRRHSCNDMSDCSYECRLSKNTVGLVESEEEVFIDRIKFQNKGVNYTFHQGGGETDNLKIQFTYI